jgi:integrase
MPSETLTSCWTTLGGDSVALGARRTPKALIARRLSAICWTSNDDDVPMSVNALNKSLRIMGCDTGPGGDHCAHDLRSTASTLLNEEGAFDGDIVEAQLAHDTEKKAPAARRGGAAPAKGDKNKIRCIYNRAAYWPNVCV